MLTYKFKKKTKNKSTRKKFTKHLKCSTCEISDLTCVITHGRNIRTCPAKYKFTKNNNMHKIYQEHADL